MGEDTLTAENQCSSTAVTSCSLVGDVHTAFSTLLLQAFWLLELVAEIRLPHIPRRRPIAFFLRQSSRWKISRPWWSRWHFNHFERSTKTYSNQLGRTAIVKCIWLMWATEDVVALLFRWSKDSRHSFTQSICKFKDFWRSGAGDSGNIMTVIPPYSPSPHDISMRSIFTPIPPFQN